jgi:nucleoside-diphosphate-sugar epimerase
MDNSKAKRLLEWTPKISLDEGLKITASYYK